MAVTGRAHCQRQVEFLFHFLRHGTEQSSRGLFFMSCLKEGKEIETRMSIKIKNPKKRARKS